MSTLQQYSSLIQSKGLGTLLAPYMDKPLSWIADKKRDISRIFNDEIGLDRVGPITSSVWDIINPNFGTGIDEGHVKDATYVALIFAILKGNDALVRNTFSKRIANVNSRLTSVGRVIGTATIKSKLMNRLSGGKKKKSRSVRRANRRKTRKN